MLAYLLNVPQTDDEWQIFSWNHRFSHQQIINTIASKTGIRLTDWQLDPINPYDVPGFLERNSQAHIDMNNILGLQTIDLQDVNFQDYNQKQAWFFLHFLEHYDAETRLNIAT